ncbi:MAG: carbohydrate-binding protein, partial [Bacteroidales bacterium]
DSAFVMDFWNIYAPRYKDETHVIYEICNEPFSWSSPYDSATLSMERWAYDTIRALAPETHILFMSYACAVNPDSVINDINQLGSGIDWNNASIAIHGYGTASENVRNFIQTIQNLGYAITNTEPPSIENYYVNLATTRIFEEEFVSYLHFVSAERISNDPSAFKSGIESSEIRWTPDFGTWPESLVEIDYRDPYQEFRAGFYDKGFGVNLLNLDSRIGYINHDDYVAYYNFDFEDGPDSVIIKASCDNTSSGSIKLFLDSLDGQLIGTYPIGYTGSWDNYERFSFPINASFNGVHKIYFLFYADHEWDIMNLESIQFKQNEVSSVRESAYSGDGIIRIYPNPASNYLTIQSPGEGSIEIYAIQGRLLQEIKLSDTSNTIAVDHFKRGNYVIRVVTKNEVYSKIINIR